MKSVIYQCSCGCGSFRHSCLVRVWLQQSSA